MKSMWTCNVYPYPEPETEQYEALEKLCKAVGGWVDDGDYFVPTHDALEKFKASLPKDLRAVDEMEVTAEGRKFSFEMFQDDHSYIIEEGSGAGGTGFIPGWRTEKEDWEHPIPNPVIETDSPEELAKWIDIWCPDIEHSSIEGLEFYTDEMPQEQRELLLAAVKLSVRAQQSWGRFLKDEPNLFEKLLDLLEEAKNESK